MNFPSMKALEFKTGHVIYNLAYTYKFQLKTTNVFLAVFPYRNFPEDAFYQFRLCLFFASIHFTLIILSKIKVLLLLLPVSFCSF